jgi:hypothetical protein
MVLREIDGRWEIYTFNLQNKIGSKKEVSEIINYSNFYLWTS